MKRLTSIRSSLSIKFLAAMLMGVAVLLSSLSAVAEDPIPFKAMMQSAGTQTPVPPKPQAGQQVQPAPITNVGKTEIVGGFLLIAVGVATMSITALLTSGGPRPSGAKTPALYAAGGGATAAGVTLVILGSHRHKAR